jgi:hypothetical protein
MATAPSSRMAKNVDGKNKNPSLSPPQIYPPKSVKVSPIFQTTLLEHTYDFFLQPNRDFHIEKDQFGGDALSVVITH